MNKERVSIHISDSAQIFIEQTVGGTKVTKSAQLDDILLCLQSSIKPAAPASSAVLPPNTLFYSHLTDTDAYSVALEYPLQHSRHYIYGNGIPGLSAAEARVRF